ncbi:hypothetical protein GCM10028785_00900 [Hydrogenophaga soli]
MKHPGVGLRGDIGQRGGAQGLGAALLARGPLRGLRCGARPWGVAAELTPRPAGAAFKQPRRSQTWKCAAAHPPHGLRASPRTKSPRPQTLRPATPAAGWVREGVEHPISGALVACWSDAKHYELCSFFCFLNKRERYFLPLTFKPNPWWFQVGVGWAEPRRAVPGGWVGGLHAQPRRAAMGSAGDPPASSPDLRRLSERSAHRARSEFRRTDPMASIAGHPEGASIQAPTQPPGAARWGTAQPSPT